MKAFKGRNLDYEKYKFLKGSIIIIEGNISSGKSTLGRYMSSYLNEIGIETKVFEEPILQSYLDLFLNDMKTEAFGFQMSMLIERQCLYERAIKFTENGGVALMDRSFFGDKVFAILHNEAGNISQKQMSVYEDVFSRMKFKPPSFVIYLEVDPKINVQRCNVRSRSCESTSYSLEYFQGLNRIYNLIIPQMSSENGIIRFDWNDEIHPSQFKNGAIFVLDKMRLNYFSL